MTDICPLCGAPHGKGLPTTALDVEVAPAAAAVPVVEPVAETPPDVLEVVADEVFEDEVVDDEVLLVADSEPDEVPDFSGLKINALRAIAKELEIKLPFGATKADIIELITAPRE